MYICFFVAGSDDDPGSGSMHFKELLHELRIVVVFGQVRKQQVAHVRWPVIQKKLQGLPVA